MNTTNESPRIYVACLACYNSGILRGTWLDAGDLNGAEMQDATDEMLAECGHAGQDWAIHAHEGFHSHRLGESDAFDTVHELAAALSEHGEAFALYFDNMGGDSVDVGAFQEAYRGVYDDLTTFAESFADETDMLHDVPKHLRPYFDFAMFGRDMELGGDVWTARGDEGLHVFWNL